MRRVSMPTGPAVQPCVAPRAAGECATRSIRGGVEKMLAPRRSAIYKGEAVMNGIQRQTRQQT